MRVGVIGTGAIAAQHLHVLRGLRDVELVGVCDRSPAMAEWAAEHFAVPRSYSDHEALLSHHELDAVHVCTPAPSHPPLIRDSLDAGAHVLVEKPAALGYSDLDALLSQAEHRGRRLVEDHNYRYERPIEQLKTLADQGELSRLTEVEIRLNLGVRSDHSRYADAHLPHPAHTMPAGVIHEFLTHMAYLALHLMPDLRHTAERRVSAAWSNHGGDTLFRYDDLDAIAITNATHARFRFSAHTGPDSFTVRLHGTDGWAEAELFHPHVQAHVPRMGGSRLSPVINQLVQGTGLIHSSVTGLARKFARRPAYPGLAAWIQQTYASFQKNEPAPVNDAQMRDTAQLIDALLEQEARL